jgi:hypothetical protein
MPTTRYAYFSEAVPGVGEIVRRRTCLPEDCFSGIDPATPVLELEPEAIVNEDIHYGVKVGDQWSITVRPELGELSKTTIDADGVDEAVITGLPKPCTVTIDGEATEVTDGELAFTADTPGQYELVIDQFPYQRWTRTVTAV